MRSAPVTPQIAVYLAMVEAEKGNTAEAITLFEQAARLSPSDARILNNLGYLYRQTGRLQEALKSFRAALRIKPLDPLTLCNLGLLQLDLNEPETALRTFDKAVAADPHNVANLYNRANTLLTLGRPQQALPDFDRALGLEAGNVSVLNRRGDAYRDLGNVAEAVRNYRAALTFSPGDISAQANLAGIYVTHPDFCDQAVEESHRSLRVLLAHEFAREGPAIVRMAQTGVSVFRLKHDLEQAQYLHAHGHQVAGIERFIETARRVMERSTDSGAETAAASDEELEAMAAFWKSPYVVSPPTLEHCLNPGNDWRALEEEYLDGKPEILTIDGFLAQHALEALRAYCLASRVWVREYPNKYLGAFANQGFSSRLHFQLARELQTRMPRVFRNYPLNQLWAFKYDATLGQGIDLHADFALVNLNFWITPDEFNLDPQCGGLKVYETPAPANWTFEDYNRDSRGIRDFLARHGAACKTIPYRCNRAVLFNSALFHRTDEIKFVDGYESRRINVTYLFGKQLQ